MHRSRIVVLIGTGLAGLALFLPQASFPVLGPVDGFDGAAWPVLLPLGILAAMALFGDRAEGHRLPVAVLAVGLACTALVFAVAKVVDAVGATRPLEGASVGAGAWTVAAASVLALVGSLLAFSRKLR